MKREADWENPGRDQLTVVELMEMNQDGYEFVVCAGHITSVIVEV
ncbi:MAG: hypothetical protein ACLUFH_00425 [Monoglobales bacterium]